MEIVKKGIPDIKELTRFLDDNRKKALRCLGARFTSISNDDLEDIFQESSLALYNNIVNGKLQEMTTSLFSYFMSICIHKAKTQMRHHFDKTSFDDNRQVVDDENSLPIQSSKLDELAFLVEDPFCEQKERKEWVEEKVREGIKQMKEPCNQILWSLYWDNFSHKTIAELFGLKNAAVSKTTASRCKDKFSKYLKANNIFA